MKNFLEMIDIINKHKLNEANKSSADFDDTSVRFKGKKSEQDEKDEPKTQASQKNNGGGPPKYSAKLAKVDEKKCKCPCFSCSKLGSCKNCKCKGCKCEGCKCNFYNKDNKKNK